MLERFNPLLRLICLLLGAVVVLLAGRTFLRGDPLANLRIPPLPTLAPAATNPPPAATTPKADAAPPAPRARQPGPPGGAEPSPPASPGVQSIVSSEIFGPVPRPPSIPTALLGIAGKHAFLRTSTGQTGLLKEGEELGGVKLLRIGTNRVLVEQQGEKKELTLFSGFGGKSLLNKGKETPQ